MITIFTLTYNEELMLPFFIKHYRNNFPNCKIVIFDNQSTDKTVQIANDYECKIIPFSTQNQISDSKYLEIKNNCWRESETNWNIICDCDELCEINQNDLEFEINNKTTIIKFEGYDMVNTSSDKDSVIINDLTKGVRNNFYDKILMFNKQKISNINYYPGCHSSNPTGEIKFSYKKYRLLHYKYIGENYLINRYKLFSDRLSIENIKKGWGFHYKIEETKTREFYNELKKNCIDLL